MGKSNFDRARAWVNGYTVVGTGIVVAAVAPGSTAAALAAIEGHMCYEIGKIYRGGDYSLGDAALAAGAVGIACVAGPMAALEAANFVPGPGWVVKGAIAGSVIKALGEAIIVHFEGTSA
jgi:hypothetical protein